jgi:hypothetical protein
MRRPFAVAAAALLVGCNVEFAEPGLDQTPRGFIDVVVVDSVEFAVDILVDVYPALSRSGSTPRILADRVRVGGIDISPFLRTNDLLRFHASFSGDEAFAALAALTTGDVALPVIEGFAQPVIEVAPPVRHAAPHGDPLPGGGLRLFTQWSQPHTARIRWQSGWLTLQDSVPAGIPLSATPLPASIDLPAHVFGPCSAAPLTARLVAAQHGPQTRSPSGYTIFSRTTLRISWSIPHPCA